MSASRTKSKKMRQKTHRYTSNVFSMFSQDQIQEFKEAFNMIDQNRDGFVDKEDLIEMMTSLGKNPDDDFLDHMIAEAPGPINFTMFLTLFGEKLNGTDPEDVIKNAFECFDHKQFGFINEERLREVMTSMGDRWSDEMVDELFHTSPINQGNFDYIEFIRTLKHGHKDKDEEKLKSSPAPKSPVSKTAPALPSTPAPAAATTAAAATPAATAAPATPKSALKKVAPPEGTKTPGAADAKPGKPTLKKAFGAPGRLNSPLLKK